MIRIGTLELDSILCLAPLAGYTNLPFRLLVRRIGGLGLATTDLVNARSLTEKKAKALKLIETTPEDRPLAVQLFGSVPEELRDAAAYLESAGFAVVDINMGCPVPKVCKTGGGAAMMADQLKTTRLARMVVDAVRIPVTAKMRLGWDANNITAPELARALADAGVAAVTVHGRTRAQGFGGPVNLPGIRAVVEAARGIPVIGNGDVTTPQAAKQMLDETGCLGVSIGRGAFYNPWVFSHTLGYLRTGVLPPEPAFEDRLQVMRQHLDLMIEVFGEGLGCRMFRKIAPWHARLFGPAKFFNKRVVTISTRAQFLEILDQYIDWRRQFLGRDGQLKPAYRPSPLPPLPAPASIEGTDIGIHTPRGPVELW